MACPPRWARPRSASPSACSVSGSGLQRAGSARPRRTARGGMTHGGQPGQGRHDQDLGAGVQGGLDHRGKTLGVVHRDVLTPARRPRPRRGLGVDAAQAPAGVGDLEGRGDVAEVLACGRLSHRPGPVTEDSPNAAATRSVAVASLLVRGTGRTTQTPGRADRLTSSRSTWRIARTIVSSGDSGILLLLQGWAADARRRAGLIRTRYGAFMRGSAAPRVVWPGWPGCSGRSRGTWPR